MTKVGTSTPERPPTPVDTHPSTSTKPPGLDTSELSKVAEGTNTVGQTHLLQTPRDPSNPPLPTVTETPSCARLQGISTETLTSCQRSATDISSRWCIIL